MKNKIAMNTADPDLLGSWPALLRAAKAARKLAERTNTPLIVWQNGQVVNLNTRHIKRRHLPATPKNKTSN